jgi:hypothetical protein
MDEPQSAEQRYSRIVSQIRQRSGVSVTAPRKRAMGSSALCVNDQIFAMLTSKGKFVVKLPMRRVTELILAGWGARFELSHGRLMREWFVAGPGLDGEWLSLAEEAFAFVQSPEI